MLATTPSIARCVLYSETSPEINQNMIYGGSTEFTHIGNAYFHKGHLFSLLVMARQITILPYFFAALIYILVLPPANERIVELKNEVMRPFEVVNPDGRCIIVRPSS